MCKTKSEDLAKLVQETDADTVRSFLLSILQKDKRAAADFTSLAQSVAPEGETDSYIDMINKIRLRYTDGGYISYETAYGFSCELQDMLDTDIRSMLDKGEHKRATRILAYMFDLMEEVEIEDEGGDLLNVADTVRDYWLEIAAAAEPDQKKRLHEWFVSHKFTGFTDLEAYIADVLRREFKESEYRQDPA